MPAKLVPKKACCAASCVSEQVPFYVSASDPESDASPMEQGSEPHLGSSDAGGCVVGACGVWRILQLYRRGVLRSYRMRYSKHQMNIPPKATFPRELSNVNFLYSSNAALPQGMETLFAIGFVANVPKKSVPPKTNEPGSVRVPTTKLSAHSFCRRLAARLFVLMCAFKFTALLPPMHSKGVRPQN